eukprot:scaffold114735_cov34-Tisochrysis_lutea.AAC.1
MKSCPVGDLRVHMSARNEMRFGKARLAAASLRDEAAQAKQAVQAEEMARLLTRRATCRHHWQLL